MSGLFGGFPAIGGKLITSFITGDKFTELF